MKAELDVKLTSGLAIAIFVALGLWQGTNFLENILSVAGDAITCTVILRFIFVKWAWKWPVFKFFERIHRTPNLEGKWIGEFQSTGNDNTPPDRLRGLAEVEITQPDIHTITIRRRSHESISSSLGEEIQVSNNGTIHLIYSYLNEPNAIVRDRSPISYGTARLELVNETPQKLMGNYWSDQKTTGILTVAKHGDS